MSGLSGATGAGRGGEVELRVGEVAREVLLSSGVGRADMKWASGGRGRWTGAAGLGIVVVETREYPVFADRTGHAHAGGEGVARSSS